MTTFKLTPETARQYLERNYNDPNVPINRMNFVRLPGNALLKTGKEHCQADFRWLRAFADIRLPEGVCVPQLYSDIVEFDFDDDPTCGFVMQEVTFETLEEYLKDKPFDDILADQVAQAYLHLRSATAQLQTPYVIPSHETSNRIYRDCVLQGHMFPRHGEADVRVTTQDDLRSKFQTITGNPEIFNEGWELAMGDLSIEDIFVVRLGAKVVSICFIDFGYSMILPPGYDLWHLQKHSSDGPNFTKPLLAAFARYGMVLDSTQADAFDKIRKYFRKG